MPAIELSFGVMCTAGVFMAMSSACLDVLADNAISPVLACTAGVVDWSSSLNGSAVFTCSDSAGFEFMMAETESLVAAIEVVVG